MENERQRIFAGAPTRKQAKDIFWQDLKRYFTMYQSKKPSESELVIYLYNGTEIHVVGLEAAERIEGQPWNGGVITEFASIKPDVWKNHIRPALSDTRGWCWKEGVPEGRNHYYDHAIAACGGAIPETIPMKGAFGVSPDDPDSAFFSWFSSDVLPPEEIEAARRELDPRTFRQEYEGSFESYEGVLYYTFDRSCVKPVITNPNLPIYLSCDFNKSPMVWELGQTYTDRGKMKLRILPEIAIPYNAKTQMAAREFVKRYRDHKNRTIYLMGDASNKYESHRDWTTDYIIITDILKEAGFRVINCVSKSNPNVNNRINVVCSLFSQGRVEISTQATYLVNDLDRNESDGKGGKDKSDPNQTHASDAFDYKIWYLFAKEFYKSTIRQS